MIPNPESLDQGLIVSVQAPQGSPMRDPDVIAAMADAALLNGACLLYTSPSPRDLSTSRMPSSA